MYLKKRRKKQVEGKEKSGELENREIKHRVYGKRQT